MQCGAFDLKKVFRGICDGPVSTSATAASQVGFVRHSGAASAMNASPRYGTGRSLSAWTSSSHPSLVRAMPQARSNASSAAPSATAYHPRLAVAAQLTQ